MAVERLTIIDVEPDYLHLGTRNPGHCSFCAAKSGCGRYLLGDVLHRQERTLTIRRQEVDRENLQPGDTVQVSLDDTILTQASLLLYLTPLVCLLLATATMQQMATTGGVHEGWVILAAVAALAAGFKIVNKLSGDSGLAALLLLSHSNAVKPDKSSAKEY